MESPCRERIRVGVVGIGFGQQVVVPAFRRHADCEVAAICSTRPKKTAEVAAKLGIPLALQSWRSMVERRDLDLIAIATPPTVQSEVARAALEKGKAVLCEKPLATTLDEAVMLARAAKDSGRPNMVDFEFMELPAWRRAREILRSGDLGRPFHGLLTWQVETYASRKGLVNWKTDSDGGGGVLNAFASHSFHYLEQLLGPIERLAARLSTATPDRSGETSTAMLLETASGANLSAHLSSSSFLGSGHRLELYLENGVLVLDNPTRDYMRGFRLRIGSRGQDRLEEIELPSHATDDGGDGRITPVARLIRRLLDWTRDGRPARPSIQDGLRVQKLIAAARRSHETRTWVEMPT